MIIGADVWLSSKHLNRVTAQLGTLADLPPEILTQPAA